MHHIISLLSSAFRHIKRSYLLVNVEFPEDLGCVQQVSVVHNPAGLVSMQNKPRAPAGSQPRSLTYFLMFQPNSGRFKTRAIQYPLMRNKNVRNPCTAASGMMYVLRRLHRSIGLM